MKRIREKGIGVNMNKEHSPKEQAIYQAVMELFEEGADLNNLTVAEITKKAGIGKGTAYEYFSDKEEMIAKALFYNVEAFCRQLYKRMGKEKNLYDKMNFLLLTMEQQVSKANCIFRLVHIMTENSMISRRAKELAQNRPSGEMLVDDMLRMVLEDELQERTVPIPSKDKMDYLVMSIFSRVLCYGMLLNGDRYNREEERILMREGVCRGICREVEELFRGTDFN